MEPEQQRNGGVRAEQVGDAVDALTVTTDGQTGAKGVIAEKREAFAETLTELRGTLAGTAAGASEKVSRMAPVPAEVKRTTTQAVGAVRRRPRRVALMAAIAGIVAAVVRRRIVASRRGSTLSRGLKRGRRRPVTLGRSR